MSVTYQQDLTLYELANVYVSKRGRLLLPTLYGAMRLAPGATAMFTYSPGIGISHRLVIPASHITNAELHGKLGRWDDQTDPVLGPFGSAARVAQERAADGVFVNRGDVINLAVTAPTAEQGYSVYAHLSYYIERQRIRWMMHGIFESGNPNYYAPP